MCHRGYSSRTVSRGLRAEQSTAADALQRPLLRRSRFRQQVSASVRCQLFRSPADMWIFGLPRQVAFFIVTSVLVIPIAVSSAGQKACMETATTQLEINQCASSHLKAADDELNRVYQAILNKYKDDREFLEKLRNAQRAWLAFRDAELAAKFPLEEKQHHYGSVYPMCANLFLAQWTRERVKQLREWLDGTEEGDVCAGSVQSQPVRVSAAQAPQKKTNLTRTDREAWHRILQWPEEFEERFHHTRPGAMSDEGGLVLHRLGQGQYLVEINISSGAYQPIYIFMYYDEANHASSPARLLEFKRYSRGEDGRVTSAYETEIAGLPTFNRRTTQLQIYSKSRGIGDCGSLVTYKFVGERPVVVEARVQACYQDEARWVVDPQRWQKVGNP